MRTSALNRNIIICAFAFLIIITGCVKNTSSPPLTPITSTIAAIIKGGSNLIILDSAMSKSGILATLDSAGPYTLFAPVDLAFRNAGIYDSTINDQSAAYLTKWMLYHIYAGYGKTIADWANEITYPNFPVQTAGGDTIFLTYNSNGLYVNGNYVIQSDVIAKNGVVQVLAGVLIPPSGKIFETLNTLSISADTTLTYFVAALQKASAGSNDLVSLLNNGGVYTVFAPTNAAFRLTADSTLESINAANADSLARLLQTHILQGRVFSSDFATDSVRFSYVGDPLVFTAGTIQSKGDSTATSFGTTNILAKNGLIHKINQVLFP
jgi:uncharacterized surface protein with fasciclin (FAS1) repeats